MEAKYRPGTFNQDGDIIKTAILFFMTHHPDRIPATISDSEVSQRPHNMTEPLFRAVSTMPPDLI